MFFGGRGGGFEQASNLKITELEGQIQNLTEKVNGKNQMIERLSKMNQNLTLDNEGLHNLVKY